MSIANPPPVFTGSGRGSTDIRKNPSSVTGMAVRRPSTGPDAPMSKSAFRFGIGSRMLIIAPNVPSNVPGAGRKNGRDAWILYRFATT